MIGTPGPMELILIFFVALLFFGAKRLPEIGSSLGKGIREFKGSVREIQREMKPPSERRTIHDSAPEPNRLRTVDGDPTEDEPRQLTASDAQ